ncbi:MAG: hypothetical protein NVS1B6_18340 [Steroidobacteraceae bacterium]
MSDTRLSPQPVVSASWKAPSPSLGGTYIATTNSARRPTEKGIKIEDAVYSYLQAMRALGHTRINTVKISKDLRIMESKVQNAIRNLRDNGALGG